MARELIKVGLSGRRGDSPYSSSTKVVRRREQVGSLVAVPTPSGNPIIFLHRATSHQCGYKAAAAYKLEYESLKHISQWRVQRSWNRNRNRFKQINSACTQSNIYWGRSDVINVILLALADKCSVAVVVVHQLQLMDLQQHGSYFSQEQCRQREDMTHNITFELILCF